MKNNQIIKAKLQDLELEQEEVSISWITYFEIKRGLLAVKATRKISDFHKFCSRVTVVFLEDLEIIERSAEIHADLKRKGTPIQDADILIAATAITRGLILVSNDSDLLRVQGIKLENWLQKVRLQVLNYYSFNDAFFNRPSSKLTIRSAISKIRLS